MVIKTDFKQKCISFYTVITCLVVPVFMAFLFKITNLFPEQNQCVYLYGFAFSLTTVLSFYAWKKKVFENRNVFFLSAAILFIAICLRIFLFPLESADYNSFLRHWVRHMHFIGWPWQIAIPITNYNLLYTYLLAIISYIPFSDLFLIKALSVIFDGILGITIIFILKNCFKFKDIGNLLGFTLAMVLPSLFLNSAAWGQCDSIYVSFLLIGIYLCLRNAPYKGCIFLGLALSAKLQAAFVFPILLFLIIYKQIGIRHLLMIPTTYILTVLPAWVCGRTLSSIIGIYFNQMQTYESLSNNAPTLWALFYGKYTFFLPMAFCVATSVIILFTFATLYLKKFRDKKDFWDALFIYSLIVPYFLPKMHERYFYTAVILSVLYVLRYPKMWAWGLGITLIDLFSYAPFLLGYSFVEMKYLSLCYLFIILRIISKFFESEVITSTEDEIVLQNKLSASNQRKTMNFNILTFFGKKLFWVGIIGCFVISLFVLKSDFKGRIEIGQPFNLPFWASSQKRIKVKHPSWEEELVFLSERTLIRLSVTDVAEVVRFNDKELWVRWNGTNNEYFFKEDNNDFYQFKL